MKKVILIILMLISLGLLVTAFVLKNNQTASMALALAGVAGFAFSFRNFQS